MDMEEHMEKSSEEVGSEDSDTLTKIYPLSELEAHTDSVCSVHFHPTNPDVFVTGGVDDKAFFFHNDDYTELTFHTDTIVQARFSNDGEYLALASMDSKVSIWQISSLDEPIANLEGPSDEILNIDWHPKGPVIAVSSGDQSIWVWHIRKNTPLAVLYGHPINMCRISPNGRYLYSGGKDGSVKVWDMKEENYSEKPSECTFSGRDFHSEEIVSIIMYQDNNVILSGGRDGSVCVANRAGNRILTKIQAFEDSVEAVDFCKEISLFLAGSMTGEIKIYELESMQCRVTIDMGSGIVKAIWVGIEVVASSVEGKLKCYDGRSGNGLRKWIGHEETILDFDVRHDKIISGSDDQRILIHPYRFVPQQIS